MAVRLRKSPSLIEHACATAKRLGAPVFPVKVGAKKWPLVDGWTNGGSVQDPLDIEMKFRAARGATHAGIPTGDRSGYLVVDRDGPGAQKWCEQHPELFPPTLVQPTQRSGGSHLYYRLPPGLKLKNSVGKIAGKVDIRANGGYVVDWSRDFKPTGTMVEAPAALIERLRAEVPGKLSIDFSAAQDIPKDKRNSTLTSIAGRWHNAGLTGKPLDAALQQLNRDHCKPPLKDREVSTIATSVSKMSTKEPEREPLGAQPHPIAWGSLDGCEPPPRTWWIQDWLGPWPTLTSGMGGVGKTRLWQAIATSLATNKRYFGTASARELRTLMWCCEDPRDEIWRNQAAINRHFDIDMSDLSRSLIVPRVGCENVLMDFVYGKPTFTPLMDHLREQVNDLKIDVLVLDNTGQTFGCNENDRHQVTKFVNGICGLTERPFCPVFLAHPARSPKSEYAGSAAWENACRMRWFMGPQLPSEDESAPTTEDIVYLCRRKANYTNRDYIRFSFDNGVFVPGEVDLQTRAVREELGEHAVLTAIARLTESGTVPNDAKNSPYYLPTKMVNMQLTNGCEKRELEAAMIRLLRKGRIKVEGVRGSSRHSRNGLAIVKGAA
jgi:AAA domain/Bifunctional DNA primase/polymerase, N-terminal/Primase C terminal 1 (PriCT-1)